MEEYEQCSKIQKLINKLWCIQWLLEQVQ
jgi:hypothetical protein